MPAQRSYCEMVASLEGGDPHLIYHDTVYGFPLQDDNELFGRLILEINQAGLSWTTILKKQDNFRRAYDGFEINRVAAYRETDRQRLLADAGIIRNRLKINAAIENAQAILHIQREMGSFKNWLDAHCQGNLGDWTKLFKKTFRFTGPEIVKEFLMSTGYLRGAHISSCPIFHSILYLRPNWLHISESASSYLGV